MPGSHGSLTKAGKVRSQTPKIDSKKGPKPIPRIRNKKNYIKRVIQGARVGQEKFDGRRKGR